MGRNFAVTIAFIGWLSLLLQFVLAMTNPVEPEPGTLERFVRFFSYFTVSTNIIVAVMFTAIAFFPATRPGAFFSRSTTQAAVTSYISIVGIVYSLFLRSVWAPAGWNAVADHALHDVMPIAAFLYWLIIAPKEGIGWVDPIKWLAYPLVYVVYSLVRGAVVSWYPYWFVDVPNLGYPTALTNTAFVFVAFAFAGLIYAALAKLFSRTANTGST